MPKKKLLILPGEPKIPQLTVAINDERTNILDTYSFFIDRIMATNFLNGGKP